MSTIFLHLSSFSAPKIFSTGCLKGAAHTQVSPNPEVHVCVCAGVDLVCHSGQMLDVRG